MLTPQFIDSQFTEPLSVGKKAKISVKMTYDGSEKGKFVLGNIYGSFEYQTDPDGSGSCTTLETVKRNEALQLAFKFYSSLGTLFTWSSCSFLETLPCFISFLLHFFIS